MTTEFLEDFFEQHVDDCKAMNDADPTEISWNDAVTWTKRFRDKYGNKQYINATKVKGYTMSKSNFKKMMLQDSIGLDGIKVYLGVDENDVFRVIIVATEEDNSDYKVPEVVTGSANLPLIAEVRPCPESCGRNNALNHD